MFILADVYKFYNPTFLNYPKVLRELYIRTFKPFLLGIEYDKHDDLVQTQFSHYPICITQLINLKRPRTIKFITQSSILISRLFK